MKVKILQRLKIILSLLLMMLSLDGCGRKGALRLPAQLPDSGQNDAAKIQDNKPAAPITPYSIYNREVEENNPNGDQFPVPQAPRN